jgi:hypothetical protein
MAAEILSDSLETRTLVNINISLALRSFIGLNLKVICHSMSMKVVSINMAISYPSNHFNCV